MNSPGRRMIDGLRDFTETLRRGENIAAHYPLAVYAKCWQCGEFRHIDLEDGRCAGCATTNDERY